MRLNNLNKLSIPGLEWVSRWRVSNGNEDTFVVPFPTTYPANIVTHGYDKFDYGHYGIHLGQEDRLTFLGDTTHTIRGSFIDCRADSPTLHQKLDITFQPTSAKTLIIPPGIAHTFFGLEGIYTINEYGLYLPAPDIWADNKSQWKIENDIINIPNNTRETDLPTIEPNRYRASKNFYYTIAIRQRHSIPSLATEFPFTTTFIDKNGKQTNLLLRKRLQEKNRADAWQAIEGIDGLGWKSHHQVRTSESSAIIPLLNSSPFYVVDHGETKYDHDSYGIHLGQEDQLTFLGPKDHIIKLTLVDCRANSLTKNTKIIIKFNPDATKLLSIPPGVAHAFEGLEKVYTINRPNFYLDVEKTYKPGTDVIDWPLDKIPYPSLFTNKIPADLNFYEEMSRVQKELMQEMVQYNAPSARLITDSKSGRQLKVVLRKKETKFH